MKNLIIVLFIFSCFGAYAQRQLEKEVDYNSEAVEIDFALASDIEIRTWKKPMIRIEASAEAEDPVAEKEFDLEILKTGSKIKIASNSKDIFKLDEKDRLTIDNEDEFEFNYVVYVPQGVQLKLSSILGNLSSEFLHGEIAVELITGDIDIRNFEGNLQLKTITGKINLPAKDTSFKAKTVMGEIYANADSGLEKKDLFVGQEITLQSKGSKNRLSLETVTGDIYLR